MSTKKVRRKAQEPAAESKPTKMDYAVAKYMRQNVPVKKTKFMHHVVEYFSGARAVDSLMQSPWAAGGKNDQLFTSREDVVFFLDRMLRLKFFHRARKIAITEQDLRRKQLKKLKMKEQKEQRKPERDDDESGSEEEDQEDDPKEEETTERVSRIADDVSAGDASAGAESESKSPKSKAKKSKTKGGKESLSPALNKRRVRLDMHLEQRFVDSSDAFVWIYTPISAGYWLLGAGVLAAAVAICLFPLWPGQLRQGVYYLSLAGGAFLIFILALTVLRTVLFALVWLATFGRHHVWILPNLTEDVGFFASFWPLYKYNYCGPSKSSEKSKSKTKKRSASSKLKTGESDISPTSTNSTNTADNSQAVGVSTSVADDQLKSATDDVTSEYCEVRQRGAARTRGDQQRSEEEGVPADSQAGDSASSDTCSQHSSSAFEMVDKD